MQASPGAVLETDSSPLSSQHPIHRFINATRGSPALTEPRQTHARRPRLPILEWVQPDRDPEIWDRSRTLVV